MNTLISIISNIYYIALHKLTSVIIISKQMKTDNQLKSISMNKNSYRLPLLLLISVLVSSCSMSKGAMDNNYKKEVSLGTSNNIVEVTQKLFGRYSYSISRSDVTANQIRFESGWKQRLITENESIRGYQNARTKILIEGRPQMRTEYGQMRHFKVIFTGITEYLVGGEWQVTELSDESKQYFDEVSYEFNTELARVLYAN